MNKLYLGDNLEVMKDLPTASVDLVATDPPYFSQTDYGDFDDQWKTIDDYLGFMVPRCAEMYRLLKDTGSLYLHCDQNASHYLKIELDKIFGVDNFRNEIVWSYRRMPSGTKFQFPRMNDSIFLYSKVRWQNTFHNQYIEPKHTSQYKKGYTRITVRGRKSLIIYDSDKVEQNPNVNLDDFDNVIERDEIKPPLLAQVWEIGMLSPNANERTGYPTQKPLTLYDLMIRTSSNENDLVLDPFAGSGTTMDAAQILKRNWIGIEKNPEAIRIIEKRLNDNHGMFLGKYEVIKK